MPPALDLDDIQSPILRRRPAPYYGVHALLRVDEAAAGRQFLRRLQPYVVDARSYASHETWVAVAFTYAGLRALGVPPDSLASFPERFRIGMAARHAALGDRDESAPARWEAPYGTGEIHIAVTLLSVRESRLRESIATANEALRDLPGVVLLRHEDFAQLPGARTQFGFRDGISFPQIEGNEQNPVPDGAAPIAAGEFILGYPAESGERLPMPQPEVLGRNGSYVGFRKIHTRVAAFRRFLQENATASMSEELLAAKLIGRWPSGAPLALAPEHDDFAIAADPGRVNAFGYGDDPLGIRCPRGAHIRRVNPRDAPMQVMSDVNLHRIIRHGATYGPPLPPGVTQDDGIARGIFFIFISARAPETLEFLRTEWLDNGNFIGLGREKDPVAGTNDGTGPFTIPMRPIRRRLQGLPNFTLTRGGEYAFLPSLSALRWIVDLPDRR